MSQFGEWMKVFRGGLPLEINSRLDAMLADMGPTVGKFVQEFITGSIAIIPASMPTVMGFITLPFFLFFILNDYELFGKYFSDLFPSSAAKHAGSVLGIIGNVMGRYIRSQIILGLIAGFIVFIGLFILRVEYAPALAAVVAVTQFIPIIGPFVSGLIIIIITLALQPDKVIWAVTVVLIAQLLLNMVFLNWVQGKYMQIHPAVVMVLLVVGGYIAGFWGMILALPVAATAWEVFKYLRSEQQDKKLQT
jgi:predicted PurR-regulated permease PerM